MTAGQEYTFKVLVPRNDKNLTLGKGVIDLGQHASVETEAKDLIIPIKFSAGSRELGNGELQLIVSNTLMKGFSSEDGMTVMSGLSGLSSQFDNDSEQDLSGKLVVTDARNEIELASISNSGCFWSALAFSIRM